MPLYNKPLFILKVYSYSLQHSSTKFFECAKSRCCLAKNLQLCNSKRVSNAACKHEQVTSVWNLELKWQRVAQKMANNFKGYFFCHTLYVSRF